MFEDGSRVEVAVNRRGEERGTGTWYLPCRTAAQAIEHDRVPAWDPVDNTQHRSHDGDVAVVFVGRFDDGEMTVGYQQMSNGTVDRACGTQLSYHPPSPDGMPPSPLVHDLYETMTVRVAPSKLAGAGEGLFARRALVRGDVCAFYSGALCAHAEVDTRPWECNDNTISLDDEWVIDVPKAFASVEHYAASLGHKANHSHTLQNAEYFFPCFHPRFGLIKGIRAIKDVTAGDEILVVYGYTDEMPSWYHHADAT